MHIYAMWVASIGATLIENEDFPVEIWSSLSAVHSKIELRFADAHSMVLNG